jgi:Coenzyme PQQ synthesis protein D (PqqD)
VVLHFDKGVYFGLNEVGTLIWNQVQQPRKVQEICDAILGEYEVSNEQSERELLTLLGELSENGSYSGMRRLHRLLASRRNLKVFKAQGGPRRENSRARVGFPAGIVEKLKNR